MSPQTMHIFDFNAPSPLDPVRDAEAKPLEHPKYRNSRYNKQSEGRSKLFDRKCILLGDDVTDGAKVENASVNPGRSEGRSGDFEKAKILLTGTSLQMTYQGNVRR